MIFFFKSDGTLIKSAPETVYQGSAEAGKVYVVAPLNANMLVDVYYELPNGERWGAYLLENNGTVINNEELPDGWALWSTTLESAITQYAGTLKVQFGFYQSGTADKVPLITSQGVTITIAKGVVRDLPSAPTADVYAQIVNAISSIKQDIANLPNEYLENTQEDKIALKNNGAIEYSENATAGTIVKRDSNGKINVADGTEDLNAVNVRKLNAELETKVTRVPIESGYYNLYGESHDGQIAVPFSMDIGLGTISQRTTTGQLKAADGVADDDLATVKQLNAVQGNYTDITNIDLNTGDTTVEYDTELGITVNAKGTLTHKNGATEQPTTKFELPIVAGEGVSIDKKETEEKVEIKSLNSNLENGTGEASLRQKYVKNNTDYSAQAIGENATAFGGKRWDMLTNSSKTPTSAEGKQSFAAGGSVHAIGDFSAAFGKDTVARQRASFATGSSTAGMTEEEFNKFFWDSTNNVGMHGGSKNDSGQICDFTGAPYERSFAFATALGCDCMAKGPRSFAAGDNAKSSNTGATATGARTTASGANSFATGADTIAAGDMSFTANKGTKATGVNSSAFGVNTKADGNHSAAFGDETQTTAPAAIAEGYKTIASGEHSHAGGGQFTEAAGANSFAYGENVHANAENSSAFGYETVAHSPNSFVVGKDNKLSDDALFIVGNGVDWNNRSTAFEVLKDGRAKVQTAPKEATDVVRLEDIKNMSATIVDLGGSNSMTGDDYTKLENNENALLIYDGVVYRRSRGTNYGYDEMQFESIDDSVQTATIYITNCVVTVADEAAGVISVTDTAGLKVGMTIMFTTSGGSILAGISYRKIASIDTANKKITMDGIVIDSDTLTAGSFIAVKGNATSVKLTNCVVTSADEAAGVISVTNLHSLNVGMYIDFRTSGGSRLAGISNRKIIAKDIANNKITVSGTVIDSDTLTSGCYITLANDIGFNKIYNRVLRIGKQKPDSTTAYVRYAYIPIGGLPVTPSKATASATSGTFTDSEWSKLQANDNNYILFNNEIYRLADKGHTTGIWSYSHTGWNGTAMQDKSINVTVSTGAWTLVVGQESGGGKYYLHNITLSSSESSALGKFYGTLLSSSNEALTISTIQSFLDKYYNSQMIVSKDFLSSGSTTVGVYRLDKLYELVGVDFEGIQTTGGIIDIDTLSDTVIEL